MTIMYNMYIRKSFATFIKIRGEYLIAVELERVIQIITRINK
jgi:hypothetical protein